MLPSASAALAVSVMFAGALKVALLAGDEMETVGNWLPVLPLANTWLILFTSFDLVLAQKISLVPEVLLVMSVISPYTCHTITPASPWSFMYCAFASIERSLS